MHLVMCIICWEGSYTQTTYCSRARSFDHKVVVAIDAVLLTAHNNLSIKGYKYKSASNQLFQIAHEHCRAQYFLLFLRIVGTWVKRVVRNCPCGLSVPIHTRLYIYVIHLVSNNYFLYYYSRSVYYTNISAFIHWNATTTPY